MNEAKQPNGYTLVQFVNMGHNECGLKKIGASTITKKKLAGEPYQVSA